MTMTRWVRIGCWSLSLALATCAIARADDTTPAQRDSLREPVYRLAQAPRQAAPRQQPVQGAQFQQQQAQAQPVAEHPLDPALRIAYDGLARIRRDIHDYTCTMVKRERVNGQLGDEEFMFAKIRNRKVVDGRVTVPFSIYLQMLKPDAIKGREVIWVEGKNNGKLVAHEGGWRKFMWANLDPDGFMAMRGQRYPLYDAGIENLVSKLIEKGERDRQRDECDVQFFQGAKINGRSCTLIKVTHPVPRPYFDFHVAEIFIDDELQVPVRYAAYQWPTERDGRPVLDEEYTYLNMRLNVGLTDADFDKDNPNYEFP